MSLIRRVRDLENDKDEVENKTSSLSLKLMLLDYRIRNLENPPSSSSSSDSTFTANIAYAFPLNFAYYGADTTNGYPISFEDGGEIQGQVAGLNRLGYVPLYNTDTDTLSILIAYRPVSEDWMQYRGSFSVFCWNTLTTNFNKMSASPFSAGISTFATDNQYIANITDASRFNRFYVLGA